MWKSTNIMLPATFPRTNQQKLCHLCFEICFIKRKPILLISPMSITSQMRKMFVFMQHRFLHNMSTNLICLSELSTTKLLMINYDKVLSSNR